MLFRISASPKLNIGTKKQYENAHVPLPLKRAAFCGNNFENVGIILRIIGEFKRIFKKSNWRI